MSKDRLKDTGKFLRNIRETRIPEAYGHIRGNRRTPGLKREEVSINSGFSTDVIARIEQGKYGSLKLEHLTGLCDYYKITDTQRKSLFNIFGVMPELDRENLDMMVDKTLQSVLNNIAPSIAYVMNCRWDIIGYNSAMKVIFKDYDYFPKLDRNVVYFMFSDKNLRNIVENWEKHARRVLEQFRYDYTKAADKAMFEEIIRSTKMMSSCFAEWWDANPIEIQEKGIIPKTLQHPKYKTLNFVQSSYTPDCNSNIKLVIYSPTDENTRVIIEKAIRSD